MNFFGKTPTVKDQQRSTDRQLRKVTRDLERDQNQLDREEKKLELEIKKLAKEGNKEGCAILAKQLIQLRKQKNRSLTARSKVQGVAMQNKMMGANVTLTNAVASTSKAMGHMNKLMNPEKVAADMKNFQMANTKMEMTDEMISDTLDDILSGSDDEAESDQIVNQVLDEIGIEVSGQMSKAPTALKGGVAADKSRLPTDEEIERQLAKLRVPE